MVKPAINGWAHVLVRNAISWEEKFVFDVWYVDYRNLKTDMKILFKTIEKVFNLKGISASERNTMTMFTGS